MSDADNGTPIPKDDLNDLLAFAKKADLEEVSLEVDDRRVAFKRRVNGTAVAVPGTAAPAAPAAKPAVPAGPKMHLVRSPMVGTFWRAPSKDRPPLVVEGDAVTAGERLAQVEAMKIPKDVISDVNGRIVKIFAENGKPVEYGQKLFEVEVEKGE